MPFFLFFFFLLLFFSSPGLSDPTTTSSNRRALHQPFFPASAPPPAASPPSPSLPKYPSSTNPQPFFPSFPGPPPPPATAAASASIPTFPANISSLIFPDTNSPHRRRHSSTYKLLPSILLPLLALSLLSLTLAFFLHRRRRRQQLHSDKPLRSDGHRLFPADAAASDGRKPPSGPATSEFLYLGTLVSSRRRSDGDPASSPPPDASSPYRKLSSPELRPLPPLSRQFRHGNADAGCSSDEEFYSPRGSSAEKESSGAPAKMTTFHAVAGKEKGRSGSPTLSTLSYPSSDSASSPAPSSPAMSSPPAGWAPGGSGVKVPFLRSDSARAEKIGSRASPPPRPPPPPPPPPTMLRALPSERKPPSSKRSSSASSEVSSQSMPSPARIGDFSSDLFASGPPQRQPPPPPPPPPPPAGYWESRIRRPQASQPPDLVTPRSIGLKNHTMAALPAEQPESSEKSEETPRPKLKPLHWDKVRASSDRAMVWDQLKSSSFQ